jgi:glycine cleavage system aminomethyltransferase T
VLPVILRRMSDDVISIALGSGRAFADLSSWRKIDVSGRVALSWLCHFGSADVTALAPGGSQATQIRSNGGLAADVTVSLAGANVLVIQDPDQQQSVLEALWESVGTFDIALEDRSEALTLFSFPGAARAPDIAGTAFAAPSCLGAGIDIFALADDHNYLLGSLQHGFTLVSLHEARAWLDQRRNNS